MSVNIYLENESCKPCHYLQKNGDCNKENGKCINSYWCPMCAEIFDSVPRVVNSILGHSVICPLCKVERFLKQRKA